MAKGGKKDANYDFYSQNEPKSRMGQGSFANMPSEAMLKAFTAPPQCYRDGVSNSFSKYLTDVSGIHENDNGKGL